MFLNTRNPEIWVFLLKILAKNQLLYPLWYVANESSLALYESQAQRNIMSETHSVKHSWWAGIGHGVGLKRCAEASTYKTTEGMMYTFSTKAQSLCALVIGHSHAPPFGRSHNVLIQVKIHQGESSQSNQIN